VLLELAIGLLLVMVVALLLYILYQRRLLTVRLEEALATEKDRIVQEALAKSRAVLKGKIGEQMAPLLEAFPFEPADARFIGSPIDYIVFSGYSKDDPTEIVLLDIKTGNAQLQPIQRKIRDLVENKRVRWMTIPI
jgi:predicted Holliday junction resolvase-like endonuclease